MAACQENSPWHREDNVAEHTMMVYRFYRDNLMSSRSERQQVLTFLAIMFHDTGKPAAKIEKYREDRGNYFIFAGHEQISARLWEDYAVSNWNFIEQIFPCLVFHDIFKIGFIIENHLPFIKANQKMLIKMRTAINYTLGSDEEISYFDCLESDQHGRISDNQEEKLKHFHEWRIAFEKIKPEQLDSIFEHEKFLYLLVGASGSGKSTFTNMNSDGIGVFSLDTCRLEFAKTKIENWEQLDDIEFYRQAFSIAIENQSQFNNFAEKEFKYILSKFNHVISDNTNVSRRSRYKWSVMAHSKGFKVVAILFPIDRMTLLERMKTRIDKRVPEEAVMRQWNQISYPRIGDDVDFVIVFNCNKK
ncbi:MAG: ATP-binding protein [Candidatus Woesearchaeota archaeon]